MDELATALKMDPFAFRRRNIGDERWLGVLDAVVKAANWPGPIPIKVNYRLFNTVFRKV